MQKKQWIQRGIGIALSLALVGINYSPFVQEIVNLPDQLLLIQGQEKTVTLGFPFSVAAQGEVSALGMQTQTIQDVTGEDHEQKTGESISFMPTVPGEASVTISLFGGALPIKTMQVAVAAERTIIPGGHSIGVALYTRGALVVGNGEIKTKQGVRNPALEAGIQPGDVILQVNGTEVENAAHLSELVNLDQGEAIQMLINRSSQMMHVQVLPAQDIQDGKFRLGLWVRDSTAGVGTLSYNDFINKKYGALGHGIMDPDTGTYLQVKNGEIMISDIIDIKQGAKGEPGELRGTFLDKQEKIGNINVNCEYGIFGDTYKNITNSLFPDGIKVGSHTSVHEGDASLLTTLDEKGIRQYKCEVVRLLPQDTPTSKGMIIRITDPVLLERTGGIVQGMSGSPIIQDGRMVGVVTHVFINDPTRGYGIYVDWMLKTSDSE